MAKIEIQEGVLLKDYSTYGIGGPAKYLVVAVDRESLHNAFLFAKARELTVLCIGKGSNILFDDKGYDGLVIVNKMDSFLWEGNQVVVGGGFSFSLLGMRTAREGFTGLEFASGIPGTVGGAIYMNAGAGGVETKDPLISVEYMHENGEIEIFTKSQIDFSYRYSMFQEMGGIVVSARFAVQRHEGAKKAQTDLLDYRMSTQPYSDKSCGCVFRNPEGTAAGKLIEECGLKGMKWGGAEISSIHANFIVNKGGATSQDILDLMAYAQVKVYHRTGKILESEVCYIPHQDSDEV